jgi:hypothetical protein
MSARTDQEHKSLEWEDIDPRWFLFWETTFSLVLEGGLNYPIDLIKTRLQVQSTVYTSSFPPYTGTVDAFRSILKHEGFIGLWRGFWITAVADVPVHVIYYGSYEFSKDRLRKLLDFCHRWAPNIFPSSQSLNLGIAFVAGGIADLTSAVVWVPLDVVQQRLQIQGKHRVYRGGLDAMKQIYKTEGVKGFYHGYAASMMAYPLSSAVSWAGYEYLKQKLYQFNVDKFPTYLKNWLGLHKRQKEELEKRKKRIGAGFDDNDDNEDNVFDEISEERAVSVQAQPAESHLVHFISGVLAGALGAVVVNPFDVAKTRLQVDSFIQQHSARWSDASGQYAPHLTHTNVNTTPIITTTTPNINTNSNISTNTNTNTNTNGKTQTQTTGLRKYSGVWNALYTVAKEEGLKALAKGMGPRILFFAPIRGLAFSVYELAKELSRLPEKKKSNKST